jgi:hypothetical protein
MKYPPSRYDSLIERINEQPLNVALGSVNKRVLHALAYHAGERRLEHSVETGSGKTTLLLSHLSDYHEVFSLNLQEIEGHPLLDSSAVFIDGPSQASLPVHRFQSQIQLALLDGPHAYPFPDLEYFFLYPHLAVGALLVIDDIQIPTISHFFQFLKDDAMFSFLERVDNTAFFRRTSAPTFDPYNDNWQNQRYNQRRFPIGMVPKLKGLYARFPTTVKARLRPLLTRLRLR